MKTAAPAICVMMCLFGSPAFAEENKPPAMPEHEGMMRMGPMHGMNEAQMDAHLRQMQERMLRDYDFMRKIREAKDEKEQAKLKDEWLQAMKQHMRANQVPQQMRMHGMPEKTP